MRNHKYSFHHLPYNRLKIFKNIRFERLSFRYSMDSTHHTYLYSLNFFIKRLIM